ncbi:flavonoid 3'-monooxygenase-like [Selaginella moellendorffii]|uniref:flavonoid 3'-monooxygenase-like n=1 Tax=Selaginella moellendorffii TaxID=88036 RepID=UPI000D1CD789|nr:flavonoid 3'-monooxygenase-like [Selaginella moellendorffii]|eukprot:XP_024540482.1 flavonoid 3'-monooxygenase-like [Selaginella moellendorffii]
MAELLRHPTTMCQAQRKIDAMVGRDRVVEESNLPRLNFLHAIVKETLQLHPPSPGCQFVGEGAGFLAGVIRGGRKEGRGCEGPEFRAHPLWIRVEDLPRDGDGTPDGAVCAGEAAARIQLGESGRVGSFNRDPHVKIYIRPRKDV